MIKDIIRDKFFLALKSDAATKDDVQTGQDLLDTLEANKLRCVGMAANMIGVKKRIIVFDNDVSYTLMYNPVIIKCAGEYTAQEGCLSLDGERKTKRYKKIKVQYEDEQFRLRIKTFEGRTAQIIQHEIDHCNGIII